MQLRQIFFRIVLRLSRVLTTSARLFRLLSQLQVPGVH